MTTQPPVRDRRAKCYWEPTYAPDLVGKMKPGLWDFSNDRGPTERFFEASTLTAATSKGHGPKAVVGVRFYRCDFQGLFVFATQFLIKDCEFNECDLALTTWDNVKFSNCTFTRSSVGQTIFRNCEFRNCMWKDVAFSSNETVFENTFVSNPAALVCSSFSTLNPEVLRPLKKTVFEQYYRRELSKGTTARALLHNLRTIGDDRTFYECVRTFELQQAFGKSVQSAHGAWTGKFWRRPVYLIASVFWTIELLVLFVFGLVNGWGATTLRPLIGLLVTFTLFGWIYSGLPDSASASLPWQRSFEITTVAGYTKVSALELPSQLQFLEGLHLVIALTLYTIFFATVVARLSRVR